MTQSDQLKHLVRLIHQLIKDTRIVRFVTTLIRKVWGEKPHDRQDPDGSDPILVRQLDSESLKSVPGQIRKDKNDDNLDADRNIIDPGQHADIDFSEENDLEAYTRNLNVPREKLEGWVAAGILRPDEIQVAEKMLKIMRKKDARRKKQEPNSDHD